MSSQSELDESNYVPYVLIVSTLLTAFGMVIAFTWGLSGYLVENGKDRTPPIWPNSFGSPALTFLHIRALSARMLNFSQSMENNYEGGFTKASGVRRSAPMPWPWMEPRNHAGYGPPTPGMRSSPA